MTLLCASVLISGCSLSEFCAVAKPDVYASEAVVDFLIENDPDHLRQDLAENEYGRQACGWGA